MVNWGWLVVNRGWLMVNWGGLVDNGSRGYLNHWGRLVNNWSWSNLNHGDRGGFVDNWSWGNLHNWGRLVRSRSWSNLHYWSRGRGVCWGWLVWGLLWVDSGSLVGDISNISLGSSGVADNLDTTVRKVDSVFSLGVVVLTVLLMGEDGSRVFRIIDSKLILKYFDL